MAQREKKRERMGEAERKRICVTLSFIGDLSVAIRIRRVFVFAQLLANDVAVRSIALPHYSHACGQLRFGSINFKRHQYRVSYVSLLTLLRRCRCFRHSANMVNAFSVKKNSTKPIIATSPFHMFILCCVS